MSAAAEIGSSANSYEILAKLAEGGMAEIFLARNAASNTGVVRHVVLKRILRERANDPAFVKMFLDEARLAAQLQHPNIAQVYDIGKLGDSYFFTMEYVHGETVRAILQRAAGLRREIPISAVLTIAAGSAAGLHHAHERIGLDGRQLGVVHRDVSPSNLMVSYEGAVKLVDFGVAKASDRIAETRSGTVKGKISYMSPEQARASLAVDRRSDLFSLGIVLWEMLTTERLYRRESDFETMRAIIEEPTPPPSSKRPEIPRGLDMVVLKLLAKSPDQRYQTAGELLEELEMLRATGGLISTSGLARFLRDVFGQRPEPWVDLQHEGELKAITVTSEPVPYEISASRSSAVDRQLAGVADFSRRDASRSAPVAAPSPPPSMGPTMPAVPHIAERPTVPYSVVNPPTSTFSAFASPASGLDPVPTPPPGRRRWLVIAVAFVAIAALTIVIVSTANKRLGSDTTAGSQEATTVQMAATPTQPAPAPAPAPAPTPEPPTPAQPEPAPSAAPADACAIETVTAALAPDCARQACAAKNEAEAKRWFTAVPAAQRRAVVDACRAAKITLEPRATKKTGKAKKEPAKTVDCVKFPLDCPR